MRASKFSIAMLLALIFLTVASARWSGQQGSSAYDPWLDFNEDGVIDVNELHQLAQAYGSSGEPTRNVTVSSHVTSYMRLGGTSNISIPAGSTWLSEMVSVDGFAKVTILIRASVTGGFVNVDLFACDDDGYEWYVERLPSSASTSLVKTYDVMSQRIRLRIQNMYSSAITVDVAVYLVA